MDVFLSRLDSQNHFALSIRGARRMRLKRRLLVISDGILALNDERDRPQSQSAAAIDGYILPAWLSFSGVGWEG
jgi:hypothetical protein